MTADVDRITGSAAGHQARTIDLVLARAHLRLGLLALARTELESAADRGVLDPAGLVDLAEVRWRTGDLVRAGDAAESALDAGITDPVACIVASEAAAANGRPTEARRYASQALAIAPDSIDILFAGMPRSAIWAPDAHEPMPSSPTLFDRALDHGPAPTPPAVEDDSRARSAPTEPAAAPMTLGLWAGDESEDPATATLPDPAEAFDAGRSALVDGSFEEAAFHFGLALRLAPALAPAVLEVTDGARARGLIVARGDAYRLAGHESEARQAYAIAARGGLPERRSRVRVKAPVPAGEPADAQPGAASVGVGDQAASGDEGSVDEIRPDADSALDRVPDPHDEAGLTPEAVVTTEAQLDAEPEVDAEPVPEPPVEPENAIEADVAPDLVLEPEAEAGPGPEIELRADADVAFASESPDHPDHDEDPHRDT